MEIIMILVFFLLLFLFYKRQSKLSLRNTDEKKYDIIVNYEKELTIILKKYEKNKEEQIIQKKLFLQKCNSELSRNIFFSTNESIAIIEKLAKI